MSRLIFGWQGKATDGTAMIRPTRVLRQESLGTKHKKRVIRIGNGPWLRCAAAAGYRHHLGINRLDALHPVQLVVLTDPGKRFMQAIPELRKSIWREQLLKLGLFREVSDLLERQPGRTVDSDFVLETIVTRMPYENCEKVFATFVRWACFGDLFAYDETTRRISML